MARDGAPAENAGREVVAGVGHYERRLGARSSTQDLWTPLRMLLVPDVGLTRLQSIWGASMDAAAFRRFSAYVTQAEAFYASGEGMPPESRPLVAYYFALNVTKAFLTCASPTTTAGKIAHGLSDDFNSLQRYWFIHEKMKVHANGVFRELATRTGMRFCPASNTVFEVQKLAPYLAETADIYEDAAGSPPKLVALRNVGVWSGRGEVWLRVEAERGELRRRGISPASLVGKAAQFGTEFRHVQSNTATVSFESAPFQYGGRQILMRATDLRDCFDRALVHSNRGTSGARHLAVISNRPDLLSQEAVSFAVFHHLSNMVRYRPEQVAKLAASKWFFLFSTWVPRAMENYLLAMTSRILHEEVRIA